MAPRTVTIADLLTQADGTPEIGVVRVRHPDLRNGAGPGVITAGWRTARLAPDGSFTLIVYGNDDPVWTPQGYSHTIEIALLGHRESYDVLLPYREAPYRLAELLPLLSPAAGAMYAPIGHTHEGGGGGGATTWAEIDGKPTVFPPSAHAHVQTDVTGLTAALAGKAATVHGHAQGDVTGLVSALAAKADLVGGVVPTAQIPAIAVTEYLGDSANQAAMLAKAGQLGDWTIRLDLGTTWVITGADPTQLANWTALSYPTAPVLSVAGRTGVVTLAPADVGLGAVNNTSDAAKPLSTATTTALAAKIDKATLTTKGDLYVATGAATITRLGVGADGQVLTADAAAAAGAKWATPSAGGGGGTAPTFARDIVTTGDVVLAEDLSAWALIPGLSFPIAAVSGDDVEIMISCLTDRRSDRLEQFEPVVSAGGVIARYASTGTASASSSNEGDPSLYAGDARFDGMHMFMSLTVAPSDLSGGNVTFGIAHRGPGGGKVYASAPYPLRWRIRNDH